VELDWMVLALIVAFGIFCIQIYLVYRKQVMLLQPTVEQLENTKGTIETQIVESDRATEETYQRTSEMEKELALLDAKRSQLQERLSENQMILIPAGDFKMGEDEEGATDEYPMHTVLLNAFLLDKYPVTNADYKMFVDITGHRPPPHWIGIGGTYPIDQADHPVVNVSWHDANAYAKWVNKRLPSEAEWEKAARGQKGQVYPWGDAFRKDNINCNNEHEGTTSVKEFPNGVSPYGVMDMCGNVCEWVEDWYFDEYYKNSPIDNPPGPPGGQYKVVRGGFFGENKAGVRCASRHYAPPAAMQEHVGFRCAKTPTK
jgi:formylglycine-generating enzyme required for sulfatase activity